MCLRTIDHHKKKKRKSYNDLKSGMSVPQQPHSMDFGVLWCLCVIVTAVSNHNISKHVFYCKSNELNTTLYHFFL